MPTRKHIQYYLAKQTEEDIVYIHIYDCVCMCMKIDTDLYMSIFKHEPGYSAI